MGCCCSYTRKHCGEWCQELCGDCPTPKECLTCDCECNPCGYCVACSIVSSLSCYECCFDLPRDWYWTMSGTCKCCHLYLCMTCGQRRRKRINEKIGEWMDENCLNGNPKIKDKTKNIASLNPHNIYLLPSPYDALNNYLFSYFTRVYDVLDDKFVRKGGLGPHNLIKHNLYGGDGKSQFSQSTVVNRTVTTHHPLEAKDELKEGLLSLVMKRRRRQRSVGQNMTRVQFDKHFFNLFLGIYYLWKSSI